MWACCPTAYDSFPNGITPSIWSLCSFVHLVALCVQGLNETMGFADQRMILSFKGVDFQTLHHRRGTNSLKIEESTTWHEIHLWIISMVCFPWPMGNMFASNFPSRLSGGPVTLISQGVVPSLDWAFTLNWAKQIHQTWVRLTSC